MLDEKQQIELAAKLLELTIEQVKEYSAFIENGELLHLSVPEKGGASLIIDKNGEVLYADSSIGFTRHLEEYKKGTRTPLEAFGN